MNAENAGHMLDALAAAVSRDGLVHKGDAATPGTPLAIAFPQNKEQVQNIVKAAGRYKIPLKAVSSGKPSGEIAGDFDGVVVNFSRMRKIFKIDALSRYAWVQPGITFGELIPALKKYGMRMNSPFLPRMSTSVAASLLEREPVLIPKYQYDYTDPLLTLEVVYGTGDDFRTGSASGPGPLEELKADKVNPWGPGSIDYMRFLTGAQGTMGLVTWVNIKTEIRPTVQKLYFVAGECLKPLAALANTILARRIPDECLILNNVNLAAVLAVDAAEYAELKAALPRWMMLAVIAGYERYPEERLKIQEKYLNDASATRGFKPETALPACPEKTDRLLELLSGCWEDKIYWKNRFSGGCKDIFFLSPLSRAADYADRMSGHAASVQWPEERLGVYIQPLVQGRGCYVEFNLYYNEADPAETGAAAKLFTDASKMLLDDGAFFSRPYGEWAGLVYDRYGEGVKALKKLKSIFDPENILNPGALCF